MFSVSCFMLEVCLKFQCQGDQNKKIEIVSRLNVSVSCFRFAIFEWKWLFPVFQVEAWLLLHICRGRWNSKFHVSTISSSEVKTIEIFVFTSCKHLEISIHTSAKRPFGGWNFKWKRKKRMKLCYSGHAINRNSFFN